MQTIAKGKDMFANGKQGAQSFLMKSRRKAKPPPLEYVASISSGPPTKGERILPLPDEAKPRTNDPTSPKHSLLPAVMERDVSCAPKHMQASFEESMLARCNSDPLAKQMFASSIRDFDSSFFNSFGASFLKSNECNNNDSAVVDVMRRIPSHCVEEASTLPCEKLKPRFFSGRRKSGFENIDGCVSPERRPGDFLDPKSRQGGQVIPATPSLASNDAILKSPFFVALACAQDPQFSKRISGGSAADLEISAGLGLPADLGLMQI